MPAPSRPLCPFPTSALPAEFELIAVLGEDGCPWTLLVARHDNGRLYANWGLSQSIAAEGQPEPTLPGVLTRDRATNAKVSAEETQHLLGELVPLRSGRTDQLGRPLHIRLVDAWAQPRFPGFCDPAPR